MSDTEQETIPVGGGLEGRARDSGATGMDALVRLMLQREEQMGRREQQMERERAEMQERLERLMTVVERSSGGSRGFVTETETARGPADQPKLVRLTESDDIEIISQRSRGRCRCTRWTLRDGHSSWHRS